MTEKKPTNQETILIEPEHPADRSIMSPPKTATIKTFPMVGLGASAGGLEALKTFFAAVPNDSGLAFIVVVHMASKQPSLLSQLLQKTTPIPVLSAEDGQLIRPNHAYVIPPNKEISIYKGQIQLMDIVKKAPPLPIDLFLRSLALDQRENAAAIILSGMGMDGTLGVKEIKANGGLVLVQDEASAGYDSMPRSVINTGLVDVIIAPQEMPARLVQYFSHPKIAPNQEPPITSDIGVQKESLKKIFTILRIQTGHDFSVYKVNTLLRRISRRMALNQISDHDKYVRYLRENSLEVEALFRELLIGVTNFFRDKESFDALEEKIFPDMIGQMSEGNTFRAWVPGCSTGEEVYSLAIVLHECLDTPPRRINLQLFGTDIDHYAIDKAREGLYPASITSDISPERLKRFFNKEGNFFQIRKEIRDHTVFSVQDVIKDPPFSRLNLLCCRNLLIYLDAATQKRLLPLFHYTLSPGGILVLGSSESIGSSGNLFEIVDKKWKIFKRREVPKSLRQMIDFFSGTAVIEPVHEILSNESMGHKSDIAMLTQQALLKCFTPTAVLIDAKGDILHIQGRTGKYLEASSGPPTLNILDLAREGLRIELSYVIRSAKSSGKEIIRRKVSVKTNGDVQLINLHVYPQTSPKELAGRLLVVFEDIDTAEKGLTARQDGNDKALSESSKIVELERELQSTRESHQTTFEELESSNEELKSTNEELQSANEELQSTNEELESSKEELQSLNEELQTINSELQNKVEELSAAHDDMHNLLNSTEIATIFVDNDLRVRRFTQEAIAIVNLIQTDIGRPLKHVVNNLTYDGLIADLTEVLKKLTPKEVEVQTQKGNWYNMRIIPYRTTDNRIDGAVLTFADIADQKRAQDILSESILEIEQARELVRAVFDLNPDPMLVIEKDGKMVIANTAFSEFMHIVQKDIEGKHLFDIQNEMLENILIKFDLKEHLLQEDNFKTSAFETETSKGKKRIFIQGIVIKKNNSLRPRTLLHILEHG